MVMMYRASLQCRVQMEQWDGTVLDINATCSNLGTKSLQLLGMHALSGCDTVLYLYGKEKISSQHPACKEFPRFSLVLGEVESTHVHH